MFTVSVVFRGQILYRYHKISQIAPNYRYVGDIWNRDKLEQGQKRKGHLKN
jgi:hypothetical protein